MTSHEILKKIKLKSMLNPIKKKKKYSREYMLKGLSVNQGCIQDRRILKIIFEEGT